MRPPDVREEGSLSRRETVQRHRTSHGTKESNPPWFPPGWPVGDFSFQE